MPVGDMRRRAILRRFQYRNLVAQLLRGMREHAAQLTAAHHTEPGGRGGAWQQGSQGGRQGWLYCLLLTAHTGGNFISSAIWVCLARNASSFSANPSSVQASIA